MFKGRLLLPEVGRRDSLSSRTLLGALCIVIAVMHDPDSCSRMKVDARRRHYWFIGTSRRSSKFLVGIGRCPEDCTICVFGAFAIREQNIFFE